MSATERSLVRGVLCTAITCIYLLAAPGIALAQGPSDERVPPANRDATTLPPQSFAGVPVAAISLQAPPRLDQPARQALAVRVGEPLDIAGLRRSLQNIYALGGVSDVQVHAREGDRGLDLEFVVFPAAHIRAIRFEGDNPVRRSLLERALTVRAGDRVTRGVLEEQTGNVQLALIGRGYGQAIVEPELILDDTGLEGTVIFHLTPGASTRLAKLEFVGDLGISEAEARESFGLRESGVFRDDQLAESLSNLRRRLAENHFFYAEVSIGAQALDPVANATELQILVTAGPRVELTLTAPDRSDEELRAMVPFFEQTSVADWILKQARNDIRAQLQEDGHWKPLVTFGRRRNEQGRNVSVSFTVFPGSTADIKRIDIVGNQNNDRDVLLGLMETQESRFLRGAPFVETNWSRDQRTILNHYRQRGYLQVRITEAGVVRDEELDGLLATLVIDEGQQTRIRQTSIEAVGGVAGYGIDSSGWAAGLTTRAGGPYGPDAVRQDETRLRILLSNQGFPRALVFSEVEEHSDPYSVDVSFSVFPGQRVRVGQLLISGNSRVRQEIIRRELSLVPGSTFTQQNLILSQSRLYQLGLFSRVDIDTARPESTEAEPTVVVRVDEGSSQRLSWGVGYSTEEQIRGLVVVGEDNLWGRNHQATASVRASFVEQRARFIYTNPYLIGRPIEGSLVGYFESVDREGFKVQNYGATVQLVKRHSEQLTSIGRYSFRDQQTFDVEIDEDLLEPEDRDAVVGSVSYSLLADTRPNPIEPRGGNYHTLDTELASRVLGSQTDWGKLFGRSYWYWELPNGAILVAAARAGIAVPYRGSLVPLPERFFAGGSTTLRGFGRNQAGPKDQNGNPLGGDLLLIGNVEYRFPIRSSLGAVVFVDVGNVFADAASVSLGEIRETLGFGIRYSTPIGPLRLDWGHLLDSRTGEDGSRLHFAIGQAF